MTGISQLEMKLHEQADQIAYLKHEVLVMKQQLEELMKGSMNGNATRKESVYD